jgi:hypothetical protein
MNQLPLKEIGIGLEHFVKHILHSDLCSVDLCCYACTIMPLLWAVKGKIVTVEPL